MQKRALRIISDDFESNYYVLLKRADWPLLYVSRLRAVALETYKSIKKQNPQFLHESFIPKQNHHDMRNWGQMIQPKIRTEKYGLNSFRYQDQRFGIPFHQIWKLYHALINSRICYCKGMGKYALMVSAHCVNLNIYDVWTLMLPWWF